MKSTPPEAATCFVFFLEKVSGDRMDFGDEIQPLCKGKKNTQTKCFTWLQFKGSKIFLPRTQLVF